MEFCYGELDLLYGWIRFAVWLSWLFFLKFRNRWETIMKPLLKAVLLLSFLSIGSISTAQAADKKAADDYMPTLITKTPLEGRMLAITMVRKTIGTIQKSSEIKDRKSVV